MVTGSPSNAARGGGVSRSPLVRYGEKFEELCGQYMALGMTYQEYWDGDAQMAKYFRDAEEYKQEKENHRAWLHGFYIYSALLDVAPVLNAMSKKKKPRPYIATPIPISNKASKRAKDTENRKKMENGKSTMQRMMKGFNSKFIRKEE